MLQKMKEFFYLEDSALKIVKFGFKISILICALSIITLLIYYKYYISHDLYEGSIILFRTGLLFAIQFLICGIALTKIKSQMN